MKNQLRKMIVILVAIFVSSAYGFAQGTITGKVQDASSGESLAGAAVKVAGTTKGAVTDENGTFELK